MELFLIRHGITDANKKGAYCGVADPILNQEGFLQVFDLKKSDNQIIPDIIYCSDRRRACQTAQILFPGMGMVITSDLCEINFGSWEGMTYQDISKSCSGLYANWMQYPYQYTPPGGEKLSDMEKRVIVFLNNIFKAHPEQKVVCVTHGGPIRVMACYLLKKEFRDFWSVSIDPASISYFQLSGQHIVSHYLNKT